MTTPDPPVDTTAHDQLEEIGETIDTGPLAHDTVPAATPEDEPFTAPVEHTGTIDLYEPIMEILTRPDL